MSAFVTTAAYAWGETWLSALGNKQPDVFAVPTPFLQQSIQVTAVSAGWYVRACARVCARVRTHARMAG
ncbi:hypothetical protein EON67_00930 [archaeon]|nr:MAG: hypothetical protein EON67_00930 [archaeon]